MSPRPGFGVMKRLGAPLLFAALALAPAYTPATASGTASRVTVPSVTGLKSQTAKRKLVALGLRVAVHTVVSSKPAGTVVSQRPHAHTLVVRGTIVRLTVAATPATAGQVTVPNVIGEEQDAAEQRLQNAGLSPNVVYVNSLELVGTVVGQDPAGGARVDSGTGVTISISRGPGP